MPSDKLTFGWEGAGVVEADEVAPTVLAAEAAASVIASDSC